MLRLLYVCFLASCACGARQNRKQRVAGHKQATKRGVLLVGIDGVQWNTLKNLNNASALTGLYAAPGECGGIQAHNALQPTYSGPSWSTLLTGVWANQHGVWTNGHGAAEEDIPSIFQLVREGVLQRDNRDAKVACVVHWTPIQTFYARDRNSLWSSGDDEFVTGEAVRLLEEEDDLDLVFAHLDDPDVVGHSRCAGSRYDTSIRVASEQVSRMHAAMQTRAQQRGEEWLLLVTTDHGRDSNGCNHGAQTAIEREWFLLSSLPFDATPWAASSLQSDVVPTVITWMGLPELNRKWQGAPLIGATEGPARLRVHATTDEGVELVWDGADAVVYRNDERLSAGSGRRVFDRYRQTGTEAVNYRVVDDVTGLSSQLYLELYKPGEPGECNETLVGSKDSGYRGCQTQTRDGIVCQKWTSQSPHNHNRTPQNFPNAGLGDHNFCRNPDGEDTIWCYTTQSGNRWAYCDPLPACDETMSGTNDNGYRGCQTRTRSGRTCQRWTVQSPNTHDRTPQNYPNFGLGDHNYCRNPDGETSIWCYTTDGPRFELCDPLPAAEAAKSIMLEGHLWPHWYHWGEEPDED